MAEIEFTKKIKVDVEYLVAKCGVRYWEDGIVNGTEDADGDLIPCRRGDYWCPTIVLKTGVVENWRQGTVASVHYKVCDDGVYTLLDGEKNEVVIVDDYVINMMCPAGDRDGDYVVMNIDATGKIEDWRIDLVEFRDSQE